ncbi:MAG TPA: phosphatidylinositol-specific phospholipase C1-like protein [Terriglobales bacterium]|nr:phosphatidylinositol-specific phospholipase C1-like protein [Terriglobales bacterium]
MTTPQFRTFVAAAVLLFLAFVGVGCGDDSGDSSGPYPRDGEIRLNQIQVLGSHNSYHIQPQGRLARALPIQEWQYTHLPLDEQFETQGIRQIEIDVFADPDGGLYSQPIGATRFNDPFDVPELDAPGFKVLHIQDLDFRSTCWTFVSCLQVVKSWSDAHPLHVPIAILIETKDDVPVQLPGITLTVPVPIDADQLDVLDEEIRSVFPPEQVLTPDDIRGSHDTLAEAIVTDGWPTLGEVRGQVLFLLDNGGPVKAAYIQGHPSLRGRILFTSSGLGEPEAAFVKLNDPIGDFDAIQQSVAAGLIVRTRADSDTHEARSGETTPRDTAIASGAQFVSTDYPDPDPDFDTGYFVEIPGGTPARCNPLNAPPQCLPADIENPAALQ